MLMNLPSVFPRSVPRRAKHVFIMGTGRQASLALITVVIRSEIARPAVRTGPIVERARRGYVRIKNICRRRRHRLTDSCF